MTRVTETVALLGIAVFLTIQAAAAAYTGRAALDVLRSTQVALSTAAHRTAGR